jgi:nucleoside-diphosphate-sugar epimerase
VDASRFQGAFGPHRVTPLEQGVAATVEWFRSRT